jgi:large subunit ribosomal protein LX
MSKVKIFKVSGEISKKRFFTPMTFSKNVAATKKEHAIEKIYAELGSRHRAKRHQINIHNVEELEGEE